MSEIVGGLNVKDVAEGVVFEVKHEDEEEEMIPSDYWDAVEGFTKLECLDVDNVYDGEPFDNIAKEMDNVQNGKIKRRILRDGYGSNPQPSSNVTIHYNAYVQYEAHPFDSTYVRKKPFSFVIGDGQVIKGLELAVKSMKLNEKSQFLIHPQLAYGSSGLNRIPPNATVLFEIELCNLMESVTNNILEANEKKFDPVYTFCLAQCVKGKRMFHLKDYCGAIKQYNVAVHKMEEVHLEDYDEQLKSDELLVRLYTNLLVCHTHIQNPKKGCIFAHRLYEMVKNKTFKISAKVYFNHAKCLRMLGDFDRAERKLNQAKRLEPQNKEILQEYVALRKVVEESRRRDVGMGRVLVNKN